MSQGIGLHPFRSVVPCPRDHSVVRVGHAIGARAQLHPVDSVQSRSRHHARAVDRCAALSWVNHIHGSIDFRLFRLLCGSEADMVVRRAGKGASRVRASRSDPSGPCRVESFGTSRGCGRCCDHSAVGLWSRWHAPSAPAPLAASLPRQSGAGFLPPHHLGGAHKRGAPYSSHRAPFRYSRRRGLRPRCGGQYRRSFSGCRVGPCRSGDMGFRRMSPAQSE